MVLPCLPAPNPPQSPGRMIEGSHSVLTKEQYIITVWDDLDTDVVGPSELDVLQEAIEKRYGPDVAMGPAAIARVLADDGARLCHPEVLLADSKWRCAQIVFDVQLLDISSLENALALVKNIDLLHEQSANDDGQHQRLRRSVMHLKTELDVRAASKRLDRKRQGLAREVAKWLTVWLQTPQIFTQWLELRRMSPEFRETFQ